MQARPWDGQSSTGCHLCRRATPIILVRRDGAPKGCARVEMHFDHFKG